MISGASEARDPVVIPKGYRSTLRRLDRAITPRVPNARIIEDPIEMANAVGVFPDPWQADVLTSDAKRIIPLCGRQTGKSATTALMATHKALTRARSTVLMISPSQRQSQEIYRKAAGYWRDLGKPVAALSETTMAVEFANGSRLISLPGTETQARGYSADLVIVDEAAKVGDDLYYALRPVLAATGGALVLLSTPWGQRGFFHHEWTAGEDWKRVKVTSAQCPRIPAQFLEAERRSLPASVYAREYDPLEFGDNEASVFRASDVEAAFTTDVTPLFT